MKMRKAATGSVRAAVGEAKVKTRPDKIAATPKVKSKVANKGFTTAEATELFTRLSRERPNPRSELDHSNAFTLLVAVVLSAQATDAGVNKATAALFKAADTATAMAALGVERIQDYIKSVGLFRMKAKNVARLAEIIRDEHGGEVPRSREALESLPGVGRKTANVVLNVAFGEPTIAVDTHIFRIGNRTGLAPGKDPLEVEQKLLAIVPDAYRMDAHHWLILHGRYVCLARKPLCGKCIIADLCRFPDKTA